MTRPRLTKQQAGQVLAELLDAHARSPQGLATDPLSQLVTGTPNIGHRAEEQRTLVHTSRGLAEQLSGLGSTPREPSKREASALATLTEQLSAWSGGQPASSEPTREQVLAKLANERSPEAALLREMIRAELQREDEE
jgi:hypothetical protein